MDLLLVEDETAIRHALGRGLERQGHRVRSAEHLAAARAQVAAAEPTLLITDLKLPDGSGLDLAEELGLPFIAMSGYAAFDEAVRALRLGCVDFFTKPVSIRDLAAAVERHALDDPERPLLVVDGPDECTLAMPDGVGFQARRLVCLKAQWYTADDAESAYATLREAAGDLRGRQIVAELMQMAECGRLVMNRGVDGTSVWLSATLDDGVALRERRQVLEGLCDRSTWRADGAIVEWHDG